MKRSMLLLNLVFVMMLPLALNATTIGSNTAVTLISTMTTLNNGDIVTGFTALQGGFFIADSTVTATWNALFPVSGSALFNGGALYLQRDVAFTDDALLSMPGTIIGNGYSMDIAPTIPNFADGCVPVLKTEKTTGNYPAGSLLSTFQSVGWSYDDRFIATVGPPSGAGFSLENYLFDGTNALRVGTNSSSGFAVAWHPFAYYLAMARSANGLMTFSVNGTTGALTQVSSVAGSYNAIDWHPAGAYIIVGGSTGAVLYPVSSTGVLGTVITPSPAISGTVFSADWNATGSYVVLGNSSGSTTVYQFDPLSGSVLIQRATVSVGPSNQVVTVAWNPVYQDTIAMGQGSSSTGDLVRLYRFNAAANTLTQIASISGLSGFICSVDWSNDGECLSVASTNGTIVSLRVYSFNVATATLRLVANSSFSSTSNIPAPATYSPINNYIAQLYSPTLNIGRLRISVPSNVTTLSDVTMVMKNDFNLNYYNLALTGDCSILGNGYTLSLQGTSTLAIAANSTLTLRNLNLTGLMPQAIQMADSSSTLILDNVTITLDGSTTFTQGTLEMAKDVAFTGQGAFIYSSTMPCIVDGQTTLLFDNDTTFSFVPASSARNLLQFTDNSSHLFLNGASLVTTRTGIDLTKGTLIAGRHATIASDATVAAEGIAFGDGVSAANNMNVQIYPAATLEVTKGIVVDNNV